MSQQNEPTIELENLGLTPEFERKSPNWDKTFKRFHFLQTGAEKRARHYHREVCIKLLAFQKFPFIERLDKIRLSYYSALAARYELHLRYLSFAFGVDIRTGIARSV